MAAITASDVTAIIETEIDEAVIENVYIPMANAFITLHLADCTIPDAVDTELRRLLTAHFMSATRDIEAGSLIEFQADHVRTRVGGALRGGIFGQGLRLTRYGQLALEMDPCGNLTDVADGKPRAEFEVIEMHKPDDESAQSDN